MMNITDAAGTELDRVCMSIRLHILLVIIIIIIIIIVVETTNKN